ncbi:ABC transporter permease [Streptomyces turgidiscabies]|uniref:ABC transporter, permease protein n=1 Tax=Streptomyces turgidiscabies (strain Car8) TaxID=698760 RepID=L7EZ18_STRT8|nr:MULTISPECIES: ABC transporter permease [Streptomyces]ELP64673.1 ABC transporter, permease protein [Streptomyces turgidiscabies Car8]MDX3498116.1 ABC transporter permease [Streptomyces turgidiscabies]GAQ76653.1 dipeptide transport system permease protein [Streptomyces turgidiscabies]
MPVLLLRQLARAAGIFLVVTFSTFCLMYGNGEGVARATLGMSASASDVRRRMAELGLDRPLLVQFSDWLGGVFTGDLGHSYISGQSVAGALEVRVPVTLALTLITLALTAVIGVVLGVTAAVHGGWVDRVVQFLSVLGTAIPNFVVAIVLVFAFAVYYRAFPATGYTSPEISPGGWLSSITLPVLALLIGSVAGSAVQFRAAVLDNLGRDYVRTLRSRGIPERQILFRHVLRNAGGPGLTVLNLQLIGTLGGAVFVEQIFALPGMGQLGNLSSQAGDVPMVMGTVLVTIVIVIVVNILGDLATMFLNPKARTR